MSDEIIIDERKDIAEFKKIIDKLKEVEDS